MRRAWKRWMIALSMSAVALVAGCASAPEVASPPAVEVEESGWFEGDEIGTVGATRALFEAESAYWAGDFEAAYEGYVAQLREHPGSPLNRYAAFRLVQIRGEVVDFYRRVREDLGGLEMGGEEVLTRLELSRLAFEVERQAWARSGADEPFRATTAATIQRWQVTPMLSPWRLLDRDQRFGIDPAEGLDDGYTSPQMADDHDGHWRPVRSLGLERLRQRVGLQRSGRYMMEGTLEVRGEEPQRVVVSGRFPAATTLWIGDQEILSHDEQDDDSARHLRALELEPGVHRVVMGWSYQRGSRNWFELLMVPEAGRLFDEVALGDGWDAPVDPGVGRTLGATSTSAHAVEPVIVDDPASATSSELYLGLLSAYASGEAAIFEPLWEALMERHPAFVPGYLMASYQVRTRRDLPAEIRDSRGISYLRMAEEREPDNLHLLVRLENLIGDQGADRERRDRLERGRELARDEEGHLRHIGPLVGMARYLERQRWNDEAEEAWREVLGVDDGHCTAMRRVQGLMSSRHAFAAPDELSPRAVECPEVMRNWYGSHPDRRESYLRLAEREAARHPYGEGAQRRWARALRQDGQRPEAAQVLSEARQRMPHEEGLWVDAIDLALGDGDRQGAQEILEEAIESVGRSRRLEQRRAHLGEGLPLVELMRDGRELAREEVGDTGLEEEVGDAVGGELDEAYFVHNKRAQQFFDDGGYWTLTHQVVRTMSRGAIDRFAEWSVPSGAMLLEARTIKEDGEIRRPEGVSGDSTLSMPGLAPGDMLEVAYLQYTPPGTVARRVDGQRFFFGSTSTSSRHTEYVAMGEDLAFESFHGAPEPQRFEHHGQEAWRFEARDLRRPRSEGRRPSTTHFLAWVRPYREGVDGLEGLDAERRYYANTLVDSMRWTPTVREAVEGWIDGASGDEDAAVMALFDGVASTLRQISAGAFSTAASHALERRSGSSVVLLAMGLNELGVEHEVYLGKSDEALSHDQAVGSLDRYRHALVRVEMPESGEVQWLQLDRRDAVFGAVEPELLGQPALCVTCDDLRFEEVQIPEALRAYRQVVLEAELDEAGALSGDLALSFRGRRAARVRTALRDRQEAEERDDYIERILTDQIGGASVVNYEVLGEGAGQEPVTISIAFERPGFARVDGEHLRVERSLFREEMEDIYARQASRVTPLWVGYQREQSYEATIAVPPSMEVMWEAQQVELDSPFGWFERHLDGDGEQVRLNSAIELGRQRVEVDDYQAFREWTREVEASGVLRFEASRRE